MTEKQKNLPLTGYTVETANNFLRNAGALVRDLTYDKEKGWQYELIGATTEGSKFTAKNEYRQVEIDGVMTPTVGSDMIESSEVSLETNLVEATVNNLKMMLNATSNESDGEEFPENYTVIDPKRNVVKDDYIKNLAIIVPVSGYKSPFIAILTNAFCTSGLEIETADKSEAKFPVTWEGRAGADDVENLAMPIRLLMPTDRIDGEVEELPETPDGETKDDKKGPLKIDGKGDE